jgi:hypothetical protein
MKTACRPFSRPGGTCADADTDPALKRRAIAGLSRWYERRRQMQFGLDDWGNWRLNKKYAR